MEVIQINLFIELCDIVENFTSNISVTLSTLNTVVLNGGTFTQWTEGLSFSEHGTESRFLVIVRKIKKIPQ